MSNREEIRKEIIDYQDAYYKGQPKISDAEFDRLWDLFKAEFPDDELFSEVGDDRVEGFEKLKHTIVMGSQDKVNSFDTLADWFRVKQIKYPVEVSLKLDGISVELNYENGKLISAITRGNGFIGDDITENALKMGGVPKFIRTTQRISVRGEILLFKKIFNEKYKNLGFSNPRNTASGIAKSKDGKNCEDLTVIVYDSNIMNTEFKTKMDYLGSLGFRTVPRDYFYSFNTVEQHIKDIEKRINDFPFAIDGLVVKQNKIDDKDILRLRPEFQRAFKFKSSGTTTILRDVDWSYNGNIITPIAVFDPVEIAGSIVKRASLVNLDEIKRLGIKLGDRVAVSKRNEIIPKIEEVVEHCGKEEIIPPVFCKKCGKILISTGTKIYCANPICSGKDFHKFMKWINTVDVQGFGEFLITDLLEKGFLNEISDLYTLDVKKYLETTKYKKMAEKAFDALHSKKKLRLETIIAGLDVEGCGEKTIRLFMDSGFDTPEKLFGATKEDLSKIRGCSEKLAEKIKKGLDEIKESFYNIIKFVEIKKVSNNLNGKVFVLTGSFSISREDLKSLIIDNGGDTRKEVSSLIDYVVAQKGFNSVRTRDAEKFNKPIIYEEDLMKMIEGKS